MNFGSRCVRPLMALGLLLSPVLAAPAEKPDDQHVGDIIGAIEGEAIAVTGR
jgi:hypothetical protein